MARFRTEVKVPSMVDAIRCDAPGCANYETQNDKLRRYFHNWLRLSGFGIEELRDELDFCGYPCLEKWLAAHKAKMVVVEAEVRSEL